MTDLDAAIRAKLNGDGLDGFESRPCLSVEGCDVNGFDEMRAALLAVLNEHPLSQDHVCVKDISAGLWYEDEPCPTLLAIAKGLGIEPA